MRRDVSFRIGSLHSSGLQSLVRVSKVNESSELLDSMKEMKAGNRDRGQENGQEGKDGRKKCRGEGRGGENREAEEDMSLFNRERVSVLLNCT